MADYIDRQAVLDAVCDLPTWYGDAGCLPFGDPQPPMEALMYPEDVVSAINNLPSADVEPVVRCKDCIFGYKYFDVINGIADSWIECRNPNGLNRDVSCDGYCSAGDSGR